MPQRGDELLASRRAKLERLIQRGIDPFPARFERTHNTKTASEVYVASEQSDIELNETISLAGRVTRLRRMGKASFIDLDDAEGRLQLFARSDLLGDSYSIIDDIDLGDFIGVTGKLLRTKTGEISLSLSGIVFLSKALRPPPEKFHGLRDIEQRYRQRYLDLMSNRDVHSAMRARSNIITKVRSFFDERGYLEVDTPVLVPIPAGAMAQPFVTKHNALDRQLYLRIATELSEC